MRADQFQRLLTLHENLTDVFLEEADPTQYPGHGRPVSEWTKDERGDRYWTKRNAAATMSIVTRVGYLIATERRRALELPTDESEGLPTNESDDVVDDMERELNHYEKMAKKKAAEVLARAGER